MSTRSLGKLLLRRLGQVITFAGVKENRFRRTGRYTGRQKTNLLINGICGLAAIRCEGIKRGVIAT